MKVSATPTALELIEDLKKTHGKDLLFHQSGGCCDGSAPMCYPAKEYLVGDQDILVGEIGGLPFYISKTQHEAWKNTDLIIDCIKGMGGMFSLEGPTGKRFLTRSKVFSDQEYQNIQNNPPLNASEISDIDGLKTTS